MKRFDATPPSAKKPGRRPICSFGRKRPHRFLFEQEPAYQGQILDIAKNTHSPLLFGSPTLRFQQDGRPYLYNSAFLVTDEGRVSAGMTSGIWCPLGNTFPCDQFSFFWISSWWASAISNQAREP